MIGKSIGLMILLLCASNLACLKAKKSPFDINNPSTLFFSFLSLRGNSSSTPEPESVINTVFPVNGKNWNDYILRDYSKDLLSQADTPCDPSSSTYTNYFSCIHGAEIRSIEISNRTSCDNLTASDDANTTGGAFNWTCGIKNNKVYIYSTGFRRGDLGDTVNNPPPGLSSLLDWTTTPPSFKKIIVTVKEGANTVTKTKADTWWTNSISHNFNSSNNLSTSGTIYTFGNSTSDFDQNPFTTYQITNSKISVLVYPGKKMYKSSSGGTKVIEMVGSFSYTWIEGRFDAINHSLGILSANTNKFLVLRNVEVTNAFGNTGIELNSTFSYLKNVQVGNTIDPSFPGIKIASNKNILENVLSFNNGYRGLDIINASSNLVLNFLSSSNSESGIYLDTNAINNNLFNVTSTLNSAFGTNIGGAGVTGNYLQNFLVANNHSTQFGFSCSIGNSDLTVLNLIVTNNNATASSMQFNSSGGLGPNSKRYMGFIKSSGTCVGGGATFDGHTGTGCTQFGLSDFTGQAIDYIGANPFPSGNPKVSSDSANTSFATGTATYSTSLRFTGFQNFYRTIGKENASAFPSTNLLNICSSGSCRAYDWSLKASDTTTRNTVPCPQTLARPTLSQNSQIILRNAYEIIGDWKGDDDGFCESNEDCIYTPNVGVYQGHGNLVAASTANTDYSLAANQCADITSLAGSGSDGGGSVTNVKLYKFEKNGY